MTAPTPINWTAIENAIQDWFSGATGLTTIWRDQSAPQPDYPFATLLTIAGPTQIHGQDEQRETTDATRALDVKITPIAQANTKYTVTINGNDYDFTSDATPTVVEITAGLKTAIDGGSEPVTVTDNGTDLDIVGNAGVRFTIEVTDDYDGSQISWANNDTGHEVQLETAGFREFTVSCQAYVTKPDSRDPAKNAKHLMSLAQSALGMYSYRTTLNAAGVSVIEPGAITNIDEILEDAFVSRANMDVRFLCASSALGNEDIGYIETVGIKSTNLGIDEDFGG